MWGQYLGVKPGLSSIFDIHPCPPASWSAVHINWYQSRRLIQLDSIISTQSRFLSTGFPTHPSQPTVPLSNQAHRLPSITKHHHRAQNPYVRTTHHLHPPTLNLFSKPEHHAHFYAPKSESNIRTENPLPILTPIPKTLIDPSDWSQTPLEIPKPLCHTIIIPNHRTLL